MPQTLSPEVHKTQSEAKESSYRHQPAHSFLDFKARVWLTRLTLLTAGGLDRVTFKGPFHPKPFHDSDSRTFCVTHGHLVLTPASSLLFLPELEQVVWIDSEYWLKEGAEHSVISGICCLDKVQTHCLICIWISLTVTSWNSSWKTPVLGLLCPKIDTECWKYLFSRDSLPLLVWFLD